MHSLEPNRFLERSDYLLKALLCSDQYFRRRTYTCRIGFERNNQNPIREWLTHKSIVLIGSDGFFFLANWGSKPRLPIENLFDSCLWRCWNVPHAGDVYRTQYKINIGIFPLNGNFHFLYEPRYTNRFSDRSSFRRCKLDVFPRNAVNGVGAVDYLTFQVGFSVPFRSNGTFWSINFIENMLQNTLVERWISEL